MTGFGTAAGRLGQPDVGLLTMTEMVDNARRIAGAVGGIDRLVIFGGGFPITIDDAIVGAIGVSGGHYSQDMEVARAGLTAVG